MAKTRSHLSVRALRPVAAGLEVLGHPVERFLEDAGIPASMLEDPDRRLPGGAMAALWKCAREFTADDRLGIHTAMAAPVESFGVHAYAALSSSTLRDAYHRTCRYQRLIHEVTELTFEDEPEEGVLRHNLPGGHSVARQPAEFLVTSWLRFGRLVTGLDWVPDLVCFEHERPVDATEHERLFGSRLQFQSGRTAMHIPGAVLDQVNPKADATLLRLLDSHADTLLERQPALGTVSGQIRGWLMESSGVERPTVEQAARTLHMSARTVRRHLRHEGTTFRKLLDGFRHERAVALLSMPRYGIADVAFLLGFSDLSSFYRAFRRWTGSTPAAFRDQLRRPDAPRP